MTTTTEPRRWTAADVLAILRRKHFRAALVPEITVVDEWCDAYPSNVHWVGERPIYTRRIDALMFETRIRTAIEIKVTRADAKRENFRKVRPWRQVTHRFVYAVPAGLIDHPPVHGCGLWWVHADGRVEVRRNAVINRTPEPLPQQVVQALAYRAAGMEMPE
ncbi:hypothetical protein NLX62_00260 [Mycobacteriaceae bacterium Msp059]|nr:hypothetical protein [Mycobacteriaceae bacterium Msp059]